MKVLTRMGEVRAAVDSFDPAEPLFLDTETTGLNPRRNLLVAIQLHQEAGPTYIIDWRNRSLWENLAFSGLLSSLFQRVLLVGHNIKFDVNFLAQNQMEVGRLYDTKVAEQVLVGQGRQEGAAYGLADVYHKYTGQSMSKEERSWFYKPRPLNEREEWREPFPPEELEYMALDVESLPAIYTKQRDQFKANPKLARVCRLEMRCLPAYAELEQTGMRVNLTGWRAFIAEKERETAGYAAELLDQVAFPILDARLQAYDEQRAKVDEWQERFDAEVASFRQQWEDTKHTGEEHWGEYKQSHMAQWREANPRPATPKQDYSLPNVDSQDQMVGALLALRVPLPLSPKGNPTLDAKLLQPLVDDYPVLQLLERERKAQKFCAAFGENLLELAEPEEEGFGRLHPTINSIGAATGRNSMSDPNLQQVPSKGDGQQLRALVQAPPGHKLVVCDFSAIEWRIMAAVTGEPQAIAWLSEGVDIHEAVARKAFGLASQVDVRTSGPVPGISYRDVAKVINYGLLYGMTEKRLARVIRSDELTARELLDGYFDTLPGFRRWLTAYAKETLQRESGHYLKSETLMGRIRVYNPPVTGRERSRVQRQSCNAVIQGTNADITKGAVALYHEDPTRHGRLIAVVHDELVVEVADAFAERERELVETHMDTAQCALLVPRLPREALPRPVAKISDHWEH